MRKNCTFSKFSSIKKVVFIKKDLLFINCKVYSDLMNKFLNHGKEKKKTFFIIIFKPDKVNRMQIKDNLLVY